MVIQRWQSVLLLLAALLMGCFTFCSLGQWQTPDYTLNFTTMGFYIEGEPTDGAPSGCLLSTWYFFIVSLMSVILPAIDIFLYKNLPLQRRVCLVEVMFIIAACTVGGLLGYTAIAYQTMGWSSVIIAPLLAVICVIMAYRLIGRDHKLLKSVDRLR